MDKDELAIHLEGDISLEGFARVLSNLSAMLRAIEKDTTGKNEIEWQVTDLQFGNDKAGSREQQTR